jgi:hypothetical protein
VNRRARVALAAAAVLALPGCTSFAGTVAAESSPGSTAGPQGESCPAERAAPDPDRPRIGLDFRLEDDLTTVTGTETVVFTPDEDTRELVFRLVPNAPDSAAAGNRLVVDEAGGEHVADSGYDAAGAEEPGGLYVLRLDDELAAGESTEVQLRFTLTLGRGTFDRFGTDEGVSWWASGFPLLAWEPGVGWAEDPFVGVLGETATSTAADTTISVSAPENLTVLMTGGQKQPSAPQDGRRTWASTEPAARDVSVAVGEFTTEERTTPGGVRVTVGALPHQDVPPALLADWTVEAIGDLEEHFGAFPYRTLTIPLLADYGGGIEYPSSILMAAGPSRTVLVHEVAHMWFYGMVGDSQFRDPWLDEAFATYAEALVSPGSAGHLADTLHLPGDVGGSMGDFEADGGSGAYFEVVYGKGGAALLAARDAAGPDAFDAALRCYVDANAWSIATPADVGAALADLPQATEVLVNAGALDKDDLPRR